MHPHLLCVHTLDSRMSSPLFCWQKRALPDFNFNVWYAGPTLQDLLDIVSPSTIHVILRQRHIGAVDRRVRIYLTLLPHCHLLVLLDHVHTTNFVQLCKQLRGFDAEIMTPLRVLLHRPRITVVVGILMRRERFDQQIFLCLVNRNHENHPFLINLRVLPQNYTKFRTWELPTTNGSSQRGFRIIRPTNPKICIKL